MDKHAWSEFASSRMEKAGTPDPATAVRSPGMSFDRTFQKLPKTIPMQPLPLKRHVEHQIALHIRWTGDVKTVTRKPGIKKLIPS